MKNYIVTLLLLSSMMSFAQVGIGTTTPSPASMLDVSSGEFGNYKGFMPPRVPDTAAQLSINPTAGEAGLMVFVVSTGCLDLWNGVAWENINCLGDAGTVWINEFHYDNAGADTDEFIEVAGLAGTDVSEYYIVPMNGANQLNYNDIFTLSGTIDDEGNGYGALSFALQLQNGPDGFALLGPDGLIQFLSYEGQFAGAGAPVNNIASEDVGVQEPDSTPTGQSLQLKGTGNTYSDFSWDTPSSESPGSLNTGQTIAN